jgi:predicted RNA-binding protein with RPS1 domain
VEGNRHALQDRRPGPGTVAKSQFEAFVQPQDDIDARPHFPNQEKIASSVKDAAKSGQEVEARVIKVDRPNAASVSIKAAIMTRTLCAVRPRP